MNMKEEKTEELKAEELNTEKAELEQETGENDVVSEEPKKRAASLSSTRNGLYLRTVIGAIVVYYGYSIIKNINDTLGNRIPLYIAAALFGVLGLFISVSSIIKLIKKDYTE